MALMPPSTNVNTGLSVSTTLAPRPALGTRRRIRDGSRHHRAPQRAPRATLDKKSPRKAHRASAHDQESGLTGRATVEPRVRDLANPSALPFRAGFRWADRGSFE